MNPGVSCRLFCRLKFETLLSIYKYKTYMDENFLYNPCSMSFNGQNKTGNLGKKLKITYLWWQVNFTILTTIQFFKYIKIFKVHHTLQETVTFSISFPKANNLSNVASLVAGILITCQLQSTINWDDKIEIKVRLKLWRILWNHSNLCRQIIYGL